MKVGVTEFLYLVPLHYLMFNYKMDTSVSQYRIKTGILTNSASVLTRKAILQGWVLLVEAGIKPTPSEANIYLPLKSEIKKKTL